MSARTKPSTLPLRIALSLRKARLLAVLAVVPACMNTYEKKVEATPEQKLELYTTTATYLYEDGSLDRAQEQAVKALEVEPENRTMRRMIGWIRLRKATNEDLIDRKSTRLNSSHS